MKKMKHSTICLNMIVKNESHVIINSYKTALNNFLIHCYQIYIVIGPRVLDPVDIIPYLKLINNEECNILFDSSKIGSIKKNIQKLIINYILSKKIFIN